jgi:TIR domain-containing protein
VMDVFISHSTKDREFVVQLATDIRKAGFEPFFDQLLNAGEGFTLRFLLGEGGEI